MNYIKPSYEQEMIETVNVLMASFDGVVDLGNGATLTETSDGGAQVGASALDVLGLR